MASIKSHLTEDQLRTFLCCPRLLSYGGALEINILLELLKYTTEYSIVDALRCNQLDYTMQYLKFLYKISKRLNLADKYSEVELQQLLHSTTELLGELFSSIIQNEFLPLFGPAPWTVKVAKTAIELKLSGIFRDSKNQTLHAIDFTPYNSMLNLRNDPVTILKCKTISSFVKPFWTGRPQCILHVFGVSDRRKLLYRQLNSNNIKDNHLHHITKLINAYENGYDYPNLPCSRSCLFKNQCFSEGL